MLLCELTSVAAAPQAACCLAIIIHEQRQFEMIFTKYFSASDVMINTRLRFVFNEKACLLALICFAKFAPPLSSPPPLFVSRHSESDLT